MQLEKFVIEILYTIEIDGTYFVMGETYEVIGMYQNLISNKCENLKKYCGLVNHYVVLKNNRKYGIPSPAAAIVPDMKDPDKMNRLAYWIKKSQGEEVKDYVALARQMHGVSIAAKQGADQADYAHQKIIQALYSSPEEDRPGQPIKVIVPEYGTLQSNAEENKLQAGIYVSIISAKFYRGDVVVYQVALTKPPLSDVTVNLSVNDTNVFLSETELLFTKDNYGILQEIQASILRGSPAIEKDRFATILHRAEWEGETVPEETVALLIKADR